jgi:hypothetical protein
MDSFHDGNRGMTSDKSFKFNLTPQTKPEEQNQYDNPMRRKKSKKRQSRPLIKEAGWTEIRVAWSSCQRSRYDTGQSGGEKGRGRLNNLPGKHGAIFRAHDMLPNWV